MMGFTPNHTTDLELDKPFIMSGGDYQFFHNGVYVTIIGGLGTVTISDELAPTTCPTCDGTGEWSCTKASCKSHGKDDPERCHTCAGSGLGTEPDLTERIADVLRKARVSGNWPQPQDPSDHDVNLARAVLAAIEDEGNQL